MSAPDLTRAQLYAALTKSLEDALVDARPYSERETPPRLISAVLPVVEPLLDELGSLRQDNEALRIEDERKHFMLAASRSIVGKLEADKAQLADLVATHERVQLRVTAERDLAQSRLTAALTENEALKAKLELPCGSCHPCDNWADETWRREGKKPPAVITWQDTLESKRELAADLSAAQTSLAAALQVIEDVRGLALEIDTEANDWRRDAHSCNARRDAAQRIRAITDPEGNTK